MHSALPVSMPARRERNARQVWAAPGSRHDKLMNTLSFALPVAVGVLAAFLVMAPIYSGGDVSFVVEELKAVFDPRGGQWMEGRYVPSLLAAIGGVIERHLVEIGFLTPAELPRLTEAVEQRLKIAAGERESSGGGGASEPMAVGQCPKCGAAALTHQEGCDFCLNCGYSRCS